jgi:hypothetical protein
LIFLWFTLGIGEFQGDWGGSRNKREKKKEKRGNLEVVVVQVSEKSEEQGRQKKDAATKVTI